MDLYDGAGRRPMALPLDPEIPVFRAHAKSFEAVRCSLNRKTAPRGIAT
jgi:hypothetical protein